MLETLDKLQQDALGEIDSIETVEQLESWRIAYLGSKGRLKEVLPLMRDVSREENPKLGSVSMK